MATPTGKAQKAIMEALEGALKSSSGDVELTALAKRPELRGIHFKDIMSAAEALKKKSLVQYDGKTIKKASHALVAFENVLLSDRIASRFAKDFSSPEALREYLREHPNADPKKHDVVKEDGQRSHGTLKIKVKAPKELAGEIGELWKNQPSGNALDRVKNSIERGEDVSLKVLNSAISILRHKVQYDATPEKATKYKALAKKLKDLAQVKD